MAPVAITLTAVPPLGIIGVGNPLVCAGFSFPGAGWLGLLLTLAVPTAVLLRPKIAIGPLLLISSFCHLGFGEAPQPPAGWIGLHTREECKSPSIECDFSTFLTVQRHAQQLAAGVLVFPEAAVRDWNDATELFWQETDELLRRRSATVLIGATLRHAGTTRNVVLVRGAETNRFVQRIPVPIGMWRPSVTGSIPLNLTGPGTMVIRGHRVAVLICYEQLIPWTWLSAVAESPTLIVAISDDSWSGGTPLAPYRSAVARSWSALFRLPIVSATND